MSKGGIAVLVIAALVFGVLGFVIGQVVQAAVETPGSADDPLVTQSYVDKLVGERTLELQTQLEDLQNFILTGETGGTTSDGTDTASADGETGTTGDNDTATPSYSSVKVSATSINVRSSASTSASVVGTASANTVLTYLGEKSVSDGFWYNVELSNGTEGWVASWVCGTPY